MMAHTDDISDLIKDFVALGFIVEIDDQFAQNMGGFEIGALIDEFKEKLKIEEVDEYSSLNWVYFKSLFSCCDSVELSNGKREHSASDILIWIVFTVFNELYTVVYYYSFFYLVVIINDMYA